MKNPFALALGGALQELRKDRYSSEEIAEHLGLHSSKYRLVEAGSAILNEIYVPKLLEIECYQSINLGHILQLLMITNIWEKNQKESFYKKNWTKIKGIESGFKMLLKKDKELLTNIEESDINTVGAIDFLLQHESSISQKEKINSLYKKLREEYEKVPCVFIPLTKGYYDNIDKEIRELQEYENVENSVKNFKERVAELNSLELTFNSKNSPDFVNKLDYNLAYGIIDGVENLEKSLTLDKYGKYISRIWETDFIGKLHLLIKSDLEIGEIEKKIHKFKSTTLFEMVYKKYVDREAKTKNELFHKGLNNLVFKRADGNDENLKKFLDNSLEYWYYEIDPETKYAFYTVKVSDENNEHYNYTILNIGEINKKQKVFQELFDKKFEFII